MNETYKLYAIRHKATLELMPQMRRGRGYSHWNPDNPHSIEFCRRMALGIPRLLGSKKNAKSCIVQWFCQPNAKNFYSEDGVDLSIKDDGRSKDALEVIEVELQIKGNA